ncbi:MAG: hypothetical protein ABS99_04030 [Acetobacteraceae bacterium SCN 69-10]|nr:pilus assembly protein [Rhodospirillales bacterium]ODU58901.1 MAG: hypothetical protein ABS99_04030 [Acetobacteraceae bacterium SCN 69-10]OJY64917.1 MAG: hypothetical protein BGP12_04065 [Rhodospirillales bacterium 70-18]
MTLLRRLLGERRGVAAVEFAIAGSALIVLTLGVIEASVLGWTQVVLQLTASQTARCAGLGTLACSDPVSYAVTTAGNWLFANAVAAANVTVERNVTCGMAPGHYVRVTVTTHFDGAGMLPPPLNGMQVSAHSCYFTGT